MVVIELDDNIRIGSYGVAQINGHHVAFGAMPDKYQAKCIACEREFVRDSDYFQLHGLDAQNFQLYSFHLFLKHDCDEQYDDIADVISDKVMMDYIGKPITDSVQVSMEREIEQLLGWRASVDLNTDANVTFK